MPSLVTLVWALAAVSVSASALTARPSALSDFDISRLLFLFRFLLSILRGPFPAKAGPVVAFAASQKPLSFAHDPENRFPLFRVMRVSCHRALAIHCIDLAG